MNPLPAKPVLRKILVVDDNPIIQRAVYFALRDKGYLVLMSGTVTDALHIIRQQRPELILLDLNFPAEAANFGGASWDGFAAIEWLQRTGDSKDIPIVVISGSDPEVSRPRALAAGAVAYFTKPFEKEKLLAVIVALLRKDAASASPKADSSPNSGVLTMA
jgi:CheY-like chemotaxis protein